MNSESNLRLRLGNLGRQTHIVFLGSEATRRDDVRVLEPS